MSSEDLFGVFNEEPAKLPEISATSLEDNDSKKGQQDRKHQLEGNEVESKTNKKFRQSKSSGEEKRKNLCQS